MGMGWSRCGPLAAASSGQLAGATRARATTFYRIKLNFVKVPKVSRSLDQGTYFCSAFVLSSCNSVVIVVM